MERSKMAKYVNKMLRHNHGQPKEWILFSNGHQFIAASLKVLGIKPHIIFPSFPKSINSLNRSNIEYPKFAERISADGYITTTPMAKRSFYIFIYPLIDKEELSEISHVRYLSKEWRSKNGKVEEGLHGTQRGFFFPISRRGPNSPDEQTIKSRLLDCNDYLKGHGYGTIYIGNQQHYQLAKLNKFFAVYTKICEFQEAFKAAQQKLSCYSNGYPLNKGIFRGRKWTNYEIFDIRSMFMKVWIMADETWNTY